MIFRMQSRRYFGAATLRVAPRLAVVALAALAAACADDGSVIDPNADPTDGTFYGAAVAMGNGTARSYFTVADGEPVEVGVALSESAMQGLPAGGGHSDGSHSPYNEFVLPMHPQNPTPFQFVELNWNPLGHEPEGIYTLPHFDFHFYTIPVAERNAIVPSDPEWAAKANRVPAPEYVPTRYVPAAPPIPGVTPADIAVPRMGVHWMDVASPELSGATFTETFIYGSWDGEIIFAEPMITKAFLESKPDFSRELPRAQKGYNPGSYRIYWNQQAREYRVALASLPAVQ